jgi:hypothetical protein
MSHPRGIHSSCPEAPSTINVTQNILKLDGSDAYFMDEIFTGAQIIASGNAAVLSRFPYTTASVTVFLNSGAQRYNIDYYIDRNRVVFYFPVDVDDTVTIKYISATTSVTSSNNGLLGDVAFMDEQFTGAQAIANSNTVVLSRIPYAATAVQVSLNSGVQRYNSDFFVNGVNIIFAFTPNPTDAIHVRYVATKDLVTDAPVPTGTLSGYGSLTIAPPGWLLMNGTQQVSAAAFPALHTFLLANTDLVTPDSISGSPYFVLKHINNTYFSGSQLVSGSTIIKT